MERSKIIAGVSKGVVFMTLSNLIVKAAGLLFKIPLTSLIGEEGMGYFNSAYTLFTWLYMLCAAGLPTAASMLIAKLPEKHRRGGALKIFRTSLVMFTTLGLLGCIVLIFGAFPISKLMRVESSAPAIMAVAPTLFLVCQSAALRGYFQGFGELRPHSVSQVAEALGKVGIGVALAYHARSTGKSIPMAAAYAAAGITLGVGIGMAVLYVAFLFSRRNRDKCEVKYTEGTKSILRRLMSAALPITLSSSVMSLTNIIDSFVMTASLHNAGMSQAETAAVWGNYSSLAVPMFNLPPVLTLPIAYALLPTLSSAMAAGNIKSAIEDTENAVKNTLMLSVPCAVGMAAMSEPILSLLFADDVAERGAMLLTLLAPSSMLLCLLGLANTILQASGHERVPLYAMLSGAVVKLTATYLLTPTMGKYATPVSTFLCYLTAALVCIGAIGVLTPLGRALSLKSYAKPLVSAAISVTLGVMIYPMVGTVISIAITAGAYFLLVFIGESGTKNQKSTK